MINKRWPRKIWGRAFVLAAALTLACTVMAGSASAFSLRKEAPDPWTYTKIYKALQGDISDRQFPQVEADSVFYAWTRAMEIVYEVYPDSGVRYTIPYNKPGAGAAMSLGKAPAAWWADNQRLQSLPMVGTAERGFLCSADTPVPGSFAIWDSNDTHPSGFAAVVEKVEDGMVEITEAEWRPDGSKPHFMFSTLSMTIDELISRRNMGKFLGFIYFLDPVNGVSNNIKKILNMNFRHTFVAQGGTATLLVTTTGDVTSISMDSPFGHIGTAWPDDLTSTVNADGTRTWHLRWYDAHLNGYGDGSLWTFYITAYVGNVAAQVVDGITVKVITAK